MTEKNKTTVGCGGRIIRFLIFLVVVFLGIALAWQFALLWGRQM
jgi:hypothetical protein